MLQTSTLAGIFRASMGTKAC